MNPQNQLIAPKQHHFYLDRIEKNTTVFVSDIFIAYKFLLNLDLQPNDKNYLAS